MARPAFAWWVLGERLKRVSRACPYCGSDRTGLVARKKLLLEARRCMSCGLIFRWPPDTEEKARKFYGDDVYASAGVTDLPGERELASALDRGFEGSPQHRPAYVDLLKRFVPPPARVLDFGSSWGYVARQMADAGYATEGLEFSRARAEFGLKKLGVRIHGAWDSVPSGTFDAVFTAHTLEHLRGLGDALSQCARVLKPRGVLLAIVPNGGGEAARRLGVGWGPFIGETHVVALTADWFRANLPRHGFDVRRVFATPDDEACLGEELACVGEKRP